MDAQTPLTSAQFPAKFSPLFEPARYKVLYGGRGAGRSWGVARWLLIDSLSPDEEGKPKLILCTRELQASIKDSVHRLLAQQIDAMGLNHLFDVQQNVIRGANGAEFAFEGIRHNITKLKSFEGAVKCWVEEGQGVTEHSWEILIPTIRRPKSEIIVTFNPDLETDATYKRFVVHTPPDCKLIYTTWRDNPWFDNTPLPAERDALKARNYDLYLWVWEGQCRKNLEGAVYAEELRECELQQRITKVPYDRSAPVSTYWDLGRSDHTSIWFIQRVGMEWRVIDFYQSRLQHIDHYLGVLQARNYLYDTLWLPHDGRAKQLGSKMTIEEQARAKFKSVRIVPKVMIKDKINSARTVFPNCWFDADKCSEGLHALRHYRFEVDEATKQFSQKPLHDENSDAASAFEYFGVASRMPGRRTLKGLGQEAAGLLLGSEDHYGVGPGFLGGAMGSRPTSTRWLG